MSGLHYPIQKQHVSEINTHDMKLTPRPSSSRALLPPIGLISKKAGVAGQ